MAYEAGGAPLPPAWKMQGKLCFQGKHKLHKNPECKKYIQYSEKSQDTLCFLGQAKVANRER